MIKKVFAGLWISSLLASSALAGQPVTLQNSANTAAAGVTGTSLNVTCTSGCAGTSGTPAVVQGNVSNASSGVATTAANVPTVAYNYIWNGTSWDQWRNIAVFSTGTSSGTGLAASGVVAGYNTTLPTYANGQYGTVQMTPNGSLDAALTPTSNSSNANVPTATAAVGSNLVVKGTPGNLYSWVVTSGASAGYVMIFNATTLPADGAVTPADCRVIAANSTIGSGNYDIPERYSTGIVIGFSTTGCFSKAASATAYIRATFQ